MSEKKERAFLGEQAGVNHPSSLVFVLLEWFLSGLSF